MFVPFQLILNISLSIRSASPLAKTQKKPLRRQRAVFYSRLAPFLETFKFSLISLRKQAIMEGLTKDSNIGVNELMELIR